VIPFKGLGKHLRADARAKHPSHPLAIKIVRKAAAGSPNPRIAPSYDANVLSNVGRATDAAILCDIPLAHLSGRTCGPTKIIANKLFLQTYLPFGNPIERLVSDRSCTQTVHPQETLASQIADSDQGT
jgi:hypothetical protein